MLTLARLRRSVGLRLELKAVKRHRSRLGRRLAPRYTEYLEACRTAFRGDRVTSPEIVGQARVFGDKGFTSFWTAENQRLADAMLAKIRREESSGADIWDADGRYRDEIYTSFPEIERLFQGTLGAFLTEVYRAHFKIFFGVLYKSERLAAAPTGSQLWHTDGGPGTCINVMFYLKDVSTEDGAMECLPWDASLAIYRKELCSGEVQRRIRSGENERDVKCGLYLDEISRSHRARVEQPRGKAGLLLPFRNNILHKGGYPEAGRVRYVCVFHVYPSAAAPPFVRYRSAGIAKSGAYPKDPAGDF
ncbi:MAG TPA: hypothetical protein VET45_14325 [Candidatus Binatia bacterium]|nr:hypothetical protein [Candidatus Binatia bacterium]